MGGTNLDICENNKIKFSIDVTFIFIVLIEHALFCGPCRVAKRMTLMRCATIHAIVLQILKD